MRCGEYRSSRVSFAKQNSNEELSGGEINPVIEATLLRCKLHVAIPLFIYTSTMRQIQIKCLVIQTSQFL